MEDPINKLQALPYIGPITSYHLAKNLGVPCAKSDRHLKRLSEMLGFNCVQQFCKEVSTLSGDAIHVVDLVLWRFATLQRDYLKILKGVWEGKSTQPIKWEFDACPIVTLTNQR